MKTTSTEQSSNITLDNTYLTGSGYWDTSSTTGLKVGGILQDCGVSTIANHVEEPEISIFGMKEKEWRDLPGRIEKIEKMLGILYDEPSPEDLDKHNALKEAYHKYKMLERMVLGNKDSEA